MSIEEIIKDLEHTIEYFEGCVDEFQRGRKHQAMQTLEQLRQYNISGSVPSDDRILAEAITAARKVNTEVGLLPNNNDIKMFCLGAKWMRDFTHSND